MPFLVNLPLLKMSENKLQTELLIVPSKGMLDVGCWMLIELMLFALKKATMSVKYCFEHLGCCSTVT